MTQIIWDVVFQEILHKILNSDEYQERSILCAEVGQLRKEIDYRENEKSMLECEIADLSCRLYWSTKKS